MKQKKFQNKNDKKIQNKNGTKNFKIKMKKRLKVIFVSFLFYFFKVHFYGLFLHVSFLF